MLKNSLKSLKSKSSSKKGFTLMEMLIVVAIIAILVAIAIPTFTSQLNNARIATDKANLRAAESQAVAAYLSDSTENAGPVTYDVTVTNDSMKVTKADLGSAAGMTGQSSNLKSTHLQVTVQDGAVTSTTWDGKLS